MSRWRQVGDGAQIGGDFECILHSRDVPATDNKSLGCCCHNSLPTMINSLIGHCIYVYNIVAQSTPVISRLLGAKIRERELSGSPVISRRLANSGSQNHTRRRLQLSNSMLSDNRGTYVSRISTHIDIAPATNHNKQH